MEVWDAYRKDLQLAGKDLIRGEVIPKGLLHAVAEVFILHLDGSILLMQRDYVKPNYPGLYASGAAGAVLKGETFLEGAIRELREETGIVCGNLKEIYQYITETTIYNGYVGVVDIEKDSIQLQVGETIDYRWVTKEEFLAFYQSEEFVPSLRERLQEFIRTRL